MTARNGKLSLLCGVLAGVCLLLFPLIVTAQKSTDLMLFFTRGGYYETVAAGENVTFTLQVTNGGTENLDNITLSVTTPVEFSISLKPQTINTLSPGNFEVVNVSITTDKNTPPDTYEILIRADTADIHQSITSTLEVQSPKGFWWLVGGIVVAVVIAGFVFVYLRYGRK